MSATPAFPAPPRLNCVNPVPDAVPVENKFTLVATVFPTLVKPCPTPKAPPPVN